MDENRKLIFENMPVNKAVWKLALPTIIGMIVMVLYNLVDTFFVGQTGDANQVAAVSLAMPVFMILIAVGNLFGIGASSMISRLLGAKNYKYVANASSYAFYSSIAFGIVAGALFLIFMPSLARIAGADDVTAPFVEGYLTYIAIGAPFIIVGNSMSYIMRSEGNAKGAMISMILGTGLNIALDPLFIFTFELGAVGAAAATSIANVASSVYMIITITRAKKSPLSLKLKDLSGKSGVAKGIYAIGVPASLSNLLMSIAFIIYNVFLVKYGNDPVAAMGIVMKVNMMYVMIFLGLTMGVQPLIGYSYGSNNTARLKGTLKYTLVCTLIAGVVFLVMFYLAAQPIIGSFIDSESVISHGVTMLRLQVLAAPLLGVVFLVMSTMQATGKSIVSLVLSLSRQGLVFIPAIVLLDTFLGYGGLIWAQTVADVMSILLSTLVLVRFMRKLPNDTQTLPHDSDALKDAT